MIYFILLLIGFVCLGIGSIFGYYARQSIARRREGTIEAKLQKKVEKVKQESEELQQKAQERANQIISEVQREVSERQRESLKREQILFRREQSLERKSSLLEQNEFEFNRKVERLGKIKAQLEKTNIAVQRRLEEISGLSETQAKKELLKKVEKGYTQELMERIQKLQGEGKQELEKRAKEILIQTIQKYALPQAQELTTTVVSLPSDELKGRIIGKEGRNIRAFEKMTGVEVLIDETPETIVLSGFNPVRRYIAKAAMERLIQDGRIQPTRIEEEVKKAKEEIESQIREAGEKAVYDTGVVDLPSRIVFLLGRLYFRLSYGQNVLLHAMEVAHLAAALADELGANRKVAKKAGLLHDIGKAVDHDFEGSHVDIGIKILEKFDTEPEVIVAMKAHHEDYPAETLEAILVKVADQISGARPGARKDTVENYLKRLEELQEIALAFSGVREAYAIQGGREIRVFVKPEEIGDLEAYKLARDIATRIHDELNYPGEIKVNVIRETRVVEYAR